MFEKPAATVYMWLIIKLSTLKRQLHISCRCIHHILIARNETVWHSVCLQIMQMHSTAGDWLMYTTGTAAHRRLINLVTIAEIFQSEIMIDINMANSAQRSSSAVGSSEWTRAKNRRRARQAQSG